MDIHYVGLSPPRNVESAMSMIVTVNIPRHFGRQAKAPMRDGEIDSLVGREAPTRRKVIRSAEASQVEVPAPWSGQCGGHRVIRLVIVRDPMIVVPL